MKKIILLMAVLTIMILSACGNNEESEQSQELPALLEVELTLPEGKIVPGSQVVLEAYVSQGGEAVDDANEVKFELLRKGDTESEFFEAEHQGEGIYTAETEFAEEGTYSITAHVTARDMHNMPSKELVVGNPSKSETETEETSEKGSG